MSDGILDGITVVNIQLSLYKLLAGYQRELAESQQHEDTWFIEYWECACQTIYDVAVELGIPFEGKQDKRHLHKPDNMIVPDTVK